MSVSSDPKLITDGLVLNIDGGSLKSYPQQKNILLKSDTPFNDGRLPTGNYNGINLYTATRSIYSELYYSGYSYTPLFSITNGQTYTFSAYIDPVDTTYLVVRILGGGGEQFANSSIAISTPGRYSVSLTVNTSVSNYAQLYLGSANGTQIKIGGIQLELGSSLSNYVSGSNANTDIYDLSSYKNNATINNSPVFTYPGFDMATTKNITTNNNLLAGLPDYSNAFSVSVWYKHTAHNAYTAFFEKQSGYSQRLDLGSYIGTIQYFTAWTNGTTYDMATNFSPALNTWYNAVLTASSTVLSGYINGNLIVSSAINGVMWPDYNHPVAIGGNNRKFNGTVSSTHIYNRTLSASEVVQNFNALRGRYGI